MKPQSAPDPAVKRLSLYLRRLERLASEGIAKVSSREFAESLDITAAKVRKDLAWFGQFGSPGVGYRVAPLIEELRRILGTDKTWNVILVGAGNFGRALLQYKGFRKKGFELVAAFDIAVEKVGRQISGVKVHHISKLSQIIRRHKVRLAIVTVPDHAAQKVAEQLCRAGIKGILNFAPTSLRVPSGVAVDPVDLAAHLEQLSFQVGSRRRK